MTAAFNDNMAKNEAYDELNAMQRNYGGPNEPANPVPYQWWPDEVGGLLKQRNQAADAWIIRGFLNQPYFGLVPVDGWIPIDTTLTYASATTMNSSADLTGTIPQYAKIRWKQGGGYKYAYLTSIAATLWTINGGSDYTVANTAITDVAWSAADNLAGFPETINYNAQWGGFSSISTKESSFRIQGRLLVLTIAVNGLSNNAYITGLSPITIPKAMRSICHVTDASSYSIGFVELSAGTAFTVYKNAPADGFNTTNAVKMLSRTTICCII
jgi:hypothetical protein